MPSSPPPHGYVNDYGIGKHSSLNKCFLYSRVYHIEDTLEGDKISNFPLSNQACQYKSPIIKCTRLMFCIVSLDKPHTFQG